jgi:hypothetical protein
MGKEMETLYNLPNMKCKGECNVSIEWLKIYKRSRELKFN